jgi:hypothetical protein
MKLTKILFSVNLAAAIPVALQASAGAQEEVKTDTAGWLKNSIASLDTPSTKDNSDQKSKSVSNAVKRAKSGSYLSAPMQAKADIMPFVPHRALPHRADVNDGLQAQTPRMARESNISLSGGVSTYYAGSQPSPYQMTPASSNASPTSAIGLRPTKSRQDRVAEMTKSMMKFIGNGQVQKSVGEVHRNLLTKIELPSRSQSSVAPQAGFPMMRQAEAMLSPGSNEQGQSGMANMQMQPFNGEQTNQMSMQMSPMQGMGAPGVSGTADSAGPPPFPLNLLPEASLKQLVRGSAPKRALGPKVSFGSWHNNSTIASLPPGGFQTYSPGRAQNRSVGKSHFSTYASNSHHATKRTATSVSKDHSVARRLPARQPQENRIAVYAPYSAQPRIF